MKWPMIRPPNPDAFYAQFESRTVAAGPVSFGPIATAVVLPPAMGADKNALVLLSWTASLLRRLGRAFSTSIIISDLPSTARGPIEEELIGANPLGAVEWRPFAPQSFADVAFAIWLGAFESVAPSTVSSVSVAAHGWACAACADPGADGGVSGLDAAPSALATAAALGVANVYGRVTGSAAIPRPQVVWCAGDSGETTSSAAGSRWFERGGGRLDPIPWSHGESPAISLYGLLVVGAGALGWNFARILVEHECRVSESVVVDHDRLDVSNLNRLIGSGFGQVGRFKAELVATSLTQRGLPTRPVTEKYERWAAGGQHSSFMSGASAVIVGVDQALTRLQVAADWPALLVNGATSGLRWVASAHHPGKGACLGCYYGSARQPYDELRRGVPCGAAAVGVTPGSQAVIAPSLSFVSFAAAAQMVAILIHARALTSEQGGDGLSGVFREQNTLAPEMGRVVKREREPRCRLLCGTERVRAVLGTR